MGLVGIRLTFFERNKSARLPAPHEINRGIRRDSHQPGAEIAFRGVLRSREAMQLRKGFQ
jgi:hypothetical protein